VNLSDIFSILTQLFNPGFFQSETAGPYTENLNSRHEVCFLASKSRNRTF